MDRLQQELNRSDTSVPFRSRSRYLHQTWAKTFLSRPELYLQPHSLEEVQKIVNLARKCRRRIVVVGSAHSPSDLTCTSSWMVNLDKYNSVLKVDTRKKTILVQAGIRLRDLNAAANKHGLTMPNLGSINEQSIAGAISTGTHGSSLQHGLLSESIRSIRIVLANGQAVTCSVEQNEDLFRAALLSLGALGIIAEVEFEMTDACNIEWEQTLKPLSEILDTWKTTLWTQKEYTRVWWMPYNKQAIVWSAERTTKPERRAPSSWYGGSVGYHTYHNLLFLSNYIPPLLPWIEWFVFGMQYGFKTGSTTTAVEPLQTGLLMNCLYSQFVNEWAIPLRRGPEAIERLSRWMNGEGDRGNIPFSVKGLYVHCPIEVRVSDTSRTKQPRPFLDPSCWTEPTLYLNATLYRPYLQDPPCRARYYEAFEWLMRDLGGRPHWAKNFAYTTRTEMGTMYTESFQQWAAARDRADPEGMFLGQWHLRNLPFQTYDGPDPEESGSHPLAEHEVRRRKAFNGGQFWYGEVLDDQTDSKATLRPLFARSGAESPSASSSGESFDMMHGGEAEKSVLFNGDDTDDDDEHEVYDEEDADLTDRDMRTHGRPTSGLTGTQVFDKM